MKRIMTLVLLAATLWPAQLTQAQDACNVTLSEQEKKELEVRAAQKIEGFMKNLRMVASKDPEVKQDGIRTTLALFYEKGEAFTDWNGVYRPDGVTMQTASASRPQHFNQPIGMKKYLQNLNTRYSKVTINQAGAVRVEGLRQVGDGRYEATAYFCQDYIGENDGRVVYRDRTWKSVKIYVKRIDVGGGSAWQVYLGDMKVVTVTKR